MSCCLDFAGAKNSIEEIVKKHTDDYKIFIIKRDAKSAIEYTVTIGVVVLPDIEVNTSMFEELLGLNSQKNGCIKVLSSDIDMRDSTVVDLIILEALIQKGQ